MWTVGESDGPRRSRGLTYLTIAGGVVAVALAVLGVFWLVHDLDRPGSRHTDVIATYRKHEAACVASGRSESACRKAVRKACLADPYWRHDHATAERYCARIG